MTPLSRSSYPRGCNTPRRLKHEQRTTRSHCLCGPHNGSHAKDWHRSVRAARKGHGAYVPKSFEGDERFELVVSGIPLSDSAFPDINCANAFARAIIISLSSGTAGRNDSIAMLSAICMSTISKLHCCC